MKITAEHIGKRYVREWIFRHLSCVISEKERWVILGGNGSGKSTLLQVLAGFQGHSTGTIQYTHREEPISKDQLYLQVSIASPYMELIEDFTPLECIQHQSIFKAFSEELSPEAILDIIELSAHEQKQVRFFSSGMKQRLKLGLAILSASPLLLLDEPISNLDRAAITWYHNLIEKYAKDKTILVASNSIREEYVFCQHEINIGDYKK